MRLSTSHELLTRLGPFVAKISTQVQRPGAMDPEPGEEGSAYIIEPRWIVTAAHVLDRDIVRLWVHHGDSRVSLRTATIVFRDPVSDIALIHVPENWWPGIASQMLEWLGGRAWCRPWSGPLGALSDAHIRIVHHPGGGTEPEVTASLRLHDVELDDVRASDGGARKFWYSASGGTVPGSSGAPIFDYRDQEPVFVGLHQGVMPLDERGAMALPEAERAIRRRAFGAPASAVAAALEAAKQLPAKPGLGDELVGQLALTWTLCMSQWLSVCFVDIANNLGGREDAPVPIATNELMRKLPLATLPQTHRIRLHRAFELSLRRIFRNVRVAPECFFELLDERHARSRELRELNWFAINSSYYHRVLLVEVFARWLAESTGALTVRTIYRGIAELIARSQLDEARRIWNLTLAAPPDRLADYLRSFKSWEDIAEDVFEEVTLFLAKDVPALATPEFNQTFAPWAAIYTDNRWEIGRSTGAGGELRLKGGSADAYRDLATRFTQRYRAKLG